LAELGQILSSRSISKFGLTGLGQNLEVFGWIHPDPNLTTLDWVDLDKIWPYSAETTATRIWLYLA